jgi:uncharacterized sporulation protein YeaH/YhbH (DUF444 family)
LLLQRATIRERARRPSTHASTESIVDSAVAASIDIVEDWHPRPAVEKRASRGGLRELGDINVTIRNGVHNVRFRRMEKRSGVSQERAIALCSNSCSSSLYRKCCLSRTAQVAEASRLI